MRAANDDLSPLLEGSLAVLRAPQLLATIEKLKADKHLLRTDLAVLLGLLRNLHRDLPNKHLADAIEHVCRTLRETA